MAKDEKRPATLTTNHEAAESRESNRQQNPAPVCPYCSKKDAQGNITEAVVCKSKGSDEYFTRYYCPNDHCSFSQKQPRPALARKLSAQDAQEGYSAR